MLHARLLPADDDRGVHQLLPRVLPGWPAVVSRPDRREWQDVGSIFLSMHDINAICNFFRLWIAWMVYWHGRNVPLPLDGKFNVIGHIFSSLIYFQINSHARYTTSSPRSLFRICHSDQCAYWVAHRLVGGDFSENTPWIPSLALAVGIWAGWLVDEASSKSKHTKTLPTSSWATQ